MRNFLLLLVATLILLLPAVAGAQITFERWYGGIDHDEGYSVVQTTDSGYIITGSTSSVGPGDWDVYLIKTDASGDTLWTRTYGGFDWDYGYSVAQTTDGGYIITGWSLSYSASEDVYLIKTNASGDTLWTRTYGGTNNDWGNSVAQTTDGGYIIAGWTYSYGAGGDVYLIKTNASGDTLWTRTYGGTDIDWGNSVAQTTDDGFIIAGYTYSYGASEDVYLIKTNSLGDTLWTRTYGGTNNDWGNSVAQTTDGGYIIAGWTDSYGTGGDVYLIKTNASGDTLWTRTYGGTIYDEGNSVARTTDGGYIITGDTYSYGAGGDDVYLVKTDSLGETLWTRTCGATDLDKGYSVAQTFDGGYIITGYTRSYGAGNGDVYLIKTDANGNVGVEEKKDQRPKTRDLRLFAHPNPFTKKTVIRYSSLVINDQLPISQFPISLSIYDVSGRLLKSFVTGDLCSGALMWNGRDNAGNQVENGVYFIRLASGDYLSVKKLILLR